MIGTLGMVYRCVYECEKKCAATSTNQWNLKNLKKGSSTMCCCFVFFKGHWSGTLHEVVTLFFGRKPWLK